MKSLFLDPTLKQLVDKVNNNNFADTKQKILTAMQSSGRFEDMRHHAEFAKISSPQKLQWAFYNYILAAENNKAIK
jgi:hypothetical protein